MDINIKGYICCPQCKRQTKTKVNHDTVLKRFPLFCPWCKKEYIVSK